MNTLHSKGKLHILPGPVKNPTMLDPKSVIDEQIFTCRGRHCALRVGELIQALFNYQSDLVLEIKRVVCSL